MTLIESAVEERGPVQRSLKVKVSCARVRAEFDQAYAKLGGKARIRGFRKGKVPRKVLEMHYGEKVRADVVRSLVEAGCREALEQHELDIVAAPRLLHQDFQEGAELTFEALVEVRPQFKLGDYKSLDAVCRTERVSSERVEQALGALRERMAVLETEEDRVNVAGGDIVVFDMYGFAEGQPLPSASGEGVQLEVGSGRFPEEFEKQLIGVTRGIKTPILVHFPDDHADSELASKTVRFDVTVREIKNKILPDLDDEFVCEVGLDDCDTLEELRHRIRADLEKRAREDAERRLRGEILGRLVDAHDFEVPASLVEEQLASMLREIVVDELPADKLEELRRRLDPQAVKQVRAGFVLDAIARAESLEISREQIEAEIIRRMKQAGQHADKIGAYYHHAGAVAELGVAMLRDKALDRVIELSTRRDEEVEESQVADRR